MEVNPNTTAFQLLCSACRGWCGTTSSQKTGKDPVVHEQKQTTASPAPQQSRRAAAKASGRTTVKGERREATQPPQRRERSTLTDDCEPEGRDSQTTESRQRGRSLREIFQEGEVGRKGFSPAGGDPRSAKTPLCLRHPFDSSTSREKTRSLPLRSPLDSQCSLVQEQREKSDFITNSKSH